MPRSKMNLQSVNVPANPLEKLPKATDRLEYKYAQDAYTDALQDLKTVLESFNQQRTRLGDTVLEYLQADATYQLDCDRVAKMEKIRDARKKKRAMQHLGQTYDESEGRAGESDAETDDDEDEEETYDFSWEEDLYDADRFGPADSIKQRLYTIRESEIQFKYTYKQLEHCYERVTSCRNALMALRPAKAHASFEGLVFNPFLDKYLKDAFNNANKAPIQNLLD